MGTRSTQAALKTYWTTWLLLLLLTAVMIALGSTDMTVGLVVTLLIAAMFGKAALISGNFMHLRFEKLALVLAVVLGILCTGLALFLGIAQDAVRVLHLSAR